MHGVVRKDRNASRRLYRCSIYTKTQGAKCHHNNVDGEALLRFVTQTLVTLIRRAGGKEKIRAAVEALPSHYGEALKLRLNGGLSYDQIAGILGCTHGQVRTWIYRGRRSLAEHLRKEGLIEGME